MASSVRPERWARDPHRSRRLRRHRPGKPVESFNGKFRDECLSEHWFADVAQAGEVIEAWRRRYNEVRPHGG